MTDHPIFICASCGNEHARRSPALDACMTWHVDVCGVCGCVKTCTESRDFGGLRDSWRTAHAYWQSRSR